MIDSRLSKTQQICWPATSVTQGEFSSEQAEEVEPLLFLWGRQTKDDLGARNSPAGIKRGN